MNFKNNVKRFFTLSRNAEGFTLVELIVVIAILGILAGIGIPAYGKYVGTAQKAVDNQNLALINNVFAVACAGNHVEPSSVATAALDWSGDTVVGVKDVTLKARATDAEIVSGIVEDFAAYIGEGATFKVYKSADITFENGKFVGPDGASGGNGSGNGGNGGSTGVYGGIFDALKENEAFMNAVGKLNTSTFGTVIGAEGLMQKVDTVTGLAAGLAEANAGFLESLVGTMGAMQTSLDMTDGEFEEFFFGVISEKAGTSDPADPAFQQARYEVLANYAVLNAAQNTGTDKTQMLNNLKGGMSVNDIKAMIDKDGDATTQQQGMANAAMMYAMYTAYANNLPSGTAEEQAAKESALSITGDIGTFALTMADSSSSQYTGFQEYLNQATGDGTSQAEKDLDGYLGAMNIINQSTAGNPDAVADLLVNGYDNQELINALEGLMG